MVGFPFALSAGTLVDLNFNSPVETTNVTGSVPTGPAYTGTTYRFLNVAPGYDLRVSVSNWGNGVYQYSYPFYSTNSGQPTGDLGYKYTSTNSYGLGGINYKMDFFESGGSFTTAKALTDFALMIYDVDGEQDISNTNNYALRQSEAVRVSMADGFYGYRLPTTTVSWLDATNSVSFLDEGSSYLFRGPGMNTAETDTSGAFILYFQNTSSITLQMESDTLNGPIVNTVFSAIDGDLSIIGKSFTNFTEIQMVPEPSVGSLVLLGTAIALRRKRRRPGG